MKKLFAVGLFAVCSLGIAGTVRTKSCEIILSSSTKIGNVQLKAGQYTLKVTGNNAVFTDMDSAKSVTTPVKVEDVAKKFENTRVDATRQGDIDVVKDIEVGGSKIKLEFGEF